MSNYDTRDERYLDQLDPEEPVVLPKRWGNVVLIAKQHAALMSLVRRGLLPVVGPEDERTDLQHDEERENGIADEEREERRWE